MFFDRYEIHIQTFLLFIDGKLIIVQSASPQQYFEKYILKIYFKKNLKNMLNYKPENREIMDFWVSGIENNEILIFLDQNEATKIQLRLLKYNLNTLPL